jgi:amino acid transporter
MTFAFSRDCAVPGHNLWRPLNSHRTPTWAVAFVATFALIITIPAYWGTKAGLPVAFLAVTSVCVIGLYIAYSIPISLCRRMGDKFQPGPSTLGRKYALRVAQALDAGVLSINSNTSVRASTPFGGFKQSGYGREPGPHALDAYTEVKSIFYATAE